MSKDLYAEITNRIVEKLNEGVVPWKMPFLVNGNLPMNFISDRTYRGINLFLLGLEGYMSPYWLTYQQVDDVNGKVNKGEKSTPIKYFKMLEIKDKKSKKESEVKNIPLLKRYRVFNIAQTTLKPEDITELPNKTIDDCESFINSCERIPQISFSRDKACFNRTEDKIFMPNISSFVSSELYYSVLFHEIIHSTGHVTRLDRLKAKSKQDNEYAKEELVAELGASMLCGKFGFENKTIDNSATYIKYWICKLKENHKLIFSAASQSQKAIEFLLEGEG